MPTRGHFVAALPWVLFLTLVVSMGILPRLLLPPTLLRIAASFGVGYSDVSALFLTGSAGFVSGLLASGFIANRITHRWTIVLSIGLNAGALLVLSTVRSLVGFHLLFAVINWASGLYPGSGIASVLSLVSPARRGTALAIHESGPNLAYLAAPVLAAVLAPTLGWRVVFRVVGAAALLVAVAFAAFGRASAERGQSPNFQNISLFLRNRPFWVVSALFIVAASGAMGVFSVLPTYLVVDHGLREELVNTLVGLSRVTGFASILLAGTLADRYGFTRVVVVVLGTTGLVTVALGLATGPALLVAVFLQPLLVGAFFPLGLSALSDVAPPAARNLSVALAIPLANFFGAGVAPRVMSWAGSVGAFRLSFVVLGILTIASLLLLRWMRPSRARAGEQPFPQPPRARLDSVG